MGLILTRIKGLLSKKGPKSTPPRPPIGPSKPRPGGPAQPSV